MTLRRSNTHGMNTLVCPHCLNVIPQAASVCTGCGAEIVLRGATRRERGSAGCATALLFGCDHLCRRRIASTATAGQ